MSYFGIKKRRGPTSMDLYRPVRIDRPKERMAVSFDEMVRMQSPIMFVLNSSIQPNGVEGGCWEYMECKRRSRNTGSYSCRSWWFTRAIIFVRNLLHFGKCNVVRNTRAGSRLCIHSRGEEHAISLEEDQRLNSDASEILRWISKSWKMDKIRRSGSANVP